MKPILISILVCIFIMATGFQVVGEEWTPDQKEVWDTLVADIENFKTGDVEKVMEARHDDFVGWFGNKRSLYGKTGARTYYKGWFGWDAPKKANLEPVKIFIIGNVANAYYTFTFIGDNYSSNGRAVETLVKEGNKWLLISHMCSLCEQPVPCK
ncbi:MAG: nuclear transport factor 2 family protein [Thermodesulfobacteriota bacterium]